MEAELTITRTEMKILFRQIARILAAMSMDRLKIVDDPVDFHGVAQSIDELLASRGSNYKPTVRELQLKERVLETTGAVNEAVQTRRANRPREVHRIDNGDRVVYVARNKRPDLTDLAPSGQKIAQALVQDGPASIKTIMKVTSLQRSTVANQLAILRDNDIVERVPVSQLANLR